MVLSWCFTLSCIYRLSITLLWRWADILFCHVNGLFIALLWFWADTHIILLYTHTYSYIDYHFAIPLNRYVVLSCCIDYQPLVVFHKTESEKKTTIYHVAEVWRQCCIGYLSRYQSIQTMFYIVMLYIHYLFRCYLFRCYGDETIFHVV